MGSRWKQWWNWRNTSGGHCSLERDLLCSHFDFKQSACSGIIGNDHAITVTDRKLRRCLIGLEMSNKSLEPFVVINDLFLQKEKVINGQWNDRR